MKRLTIVSQRAFLLFLLLTAGALGALAQVQGIDCTPSSANKNKLACLIDRTVTPSGYTFSGISFPFGPNSVPLGNSLALLPSDIGSEVSQLPLASPASGIIFTIDPTLHVPVPSDQSFGPILTQRASTIGRHKWYIATTYQYFLLEDIDGHGLKNLPVVFTLNSNGNSNPKVPDTITVGNDRIDLKIHQFVWYTTFGLTDRIDVSINVPFLRVDMRDTVNETLTNTNTASGGLTTPNSSAQEATGIGDVVFAIKDNMWRMRNGGGITVGGEVRTPTGDAFNLLGSGAVGVKPYLNFTFPGRVSPHGNIGYQGNGFSSLSPGSRLPDRLFYSGGADWKALARLTVSADVLAQYVRNGPRAVLEPPVSTGAGGFSVPASIGSVYSSYDRADAALGLKARPFGNFLITANVLVALDHSGLRQRWAPTLGLSTSF